tara:strand:- start:974 stop:2185 length:1212 start_codon:yes stop_codon:yes gene_type:complete
MVNGSNEENGGPLVGIKVLDLTRFQAGPICTMILGDMGAEVIKLEEPGGGDHARQNSPAIDGLSVYFAAYNRNKRSATLNLKTEKGKDLLRGLIKQSDVLVENFRPGVMARLGFSYEEVSEINPGIIMVSSSGFGQTGPYAKRAAFDTVAQAMSGIMAVTGYDDRPGVRVGPAIADSTAGFFGAMGAILALYHKRSTGEGQHVDVSLLEGQLVLMGYTLMRQYLGMGMKREGSNSAGAGPADAFPTADGKLVYIFAHDASHFPRICGLMGKPEMADDPRYNSRGGRMEHRNELNAMVTQWTSTLTADALEAILGEAELPYGRVNEVADVLEDPQVRAREMLVEVDHHGKGVLPLVGVFPKLSKTPGSIRMPCPLLGQHNEEVYCGILDVSKEEFATLQAEEVI